MLGKCLCSCNDTKCSCRCAEGGEPEYLHMNDIVAEEEENLSEPSQVVRVQIPSQLRDAADNIPTEVGIPRKSSDDLDGRDIVAEANSEAMNKIKKQIIAHEMQKNEGKLVTSYGKGCGKSPFKRDATPFGRPSFMDEELAYTTLDADYSPIFS